MQPKDDDDRPINRQDAQLRLILRRYRDRVALGVRDGYVEYLYEPHHILVREEYLRDIRAILETNRIGVVAERDRPTVRGLALLRLDPNVDVPAVLDLIAYGGPRRMHPGDRDRERELHGPPLGAGVATPNHFIDLTGWAGNCPANEPEPVPTGTLPVPEEAHDRDAGAGVRIVVADTGLDPAAPGRFSWLDGVTGDPDPRIGIPLLAEYAGHGTFIAGVIRCVAPAAEVHVRDVFGLTTPPFETEVVSKLEDILANDDPDIISLSAGTWTRDNQDLLTLQAFNANHLSLHKGVVLVAAGGNNHYRQPFWPAAAPYTLSVGALDTAWSARADFSAYGGWVDLYAPGEDLVNAYPQGTYTYEEPPHVPGSQQQFNGLAKWSGTSFSTPLVAAMVAVRMAHTGENGRTAAAALLQQALAQHVPGVGATLVPY